MRINEFIKRALRSALVFTVAVIVLTGMAVAQVPSSQGPYNSDFGAVFTNTARVPGTYNSPQLSNNSYLGVICTWNQTAASGSPSTAINIQLFDSASNTYQTLGTGLSSLTATGTPSSIMVYPGIASSGLLAGTVLAHLPRFWRVQEVITGANTTSTGTVGCGYLK